MQSMRQGLDVSLHCYGTFSARGSKHLFFLEVGQMPAASRDSIQFHMVSYCSAIK